MTKVRDIYKGAGRLILSLGPGIFCIGYTIGTGSVTSMIKAGSMYGTQLSMGAFPECFFCLDPDGKLRQVCCSHRRNGHPQFSGNI